MFSAIKMMKLIFAVLNVSYASGPYTRSAIKRQFSILLFTIFFTKFMIVLTTLSQESQNLIAKQKVSLIFVEI